jgi:hypothetical protein
LARQFLLDEDNITVFDADMTKLHSSFRDTNFTYLLRPPGPYHIVGTVDFAFRTATRIALPPPVTADPARVPTIDALGQILQYKRTRALTGKGVYPEALRGDAHSSQSRAFRRRAERYALDVDADGELQLARARMKEDQIVSLPVLTAELEVRTRAINFIRCTSIGFARARGACAICLRRMVNSTA